MLIFDAILLILTHLISISSSLPSGNTLGTLAGPKDQSYFKIE